MFEQIFVKSINDRIVYSISELQAGRIKDAHRTLIPIVARTYGIKSSVDETDRIVTSVFDLFKDNMSVTEIDSVVSLLNESMKASDKIFDAKRNTSDPFLSVKEVTPDHYAVGGYGVIFGGKDLDGDTFFPSTDYWLDRIISKKTYYNHRRGNLDFPIGNTVKEAPDKYGIWMEAQLDRHKEYMDYVMKLVHQGVIGLSTGAPPHLVVREAGKMLEWPIVEYSLTPSPSEPRTIGVSEKSSLLFNEINPEDYRKIFTGWTPVQESKTATTFVDLPLASADTAWDSGEAVQRMRKKASSDSSGDKSTIDWSLYRNGFFWYDRDNKESFGAYKLPFADVIDGKLQAVWRGVSAAMGALKGARGGVDIPSSEWEGVYNHIARYYKKFGKEAPEKKSLEIETIGNTEGDMDLKDLAKEEAIKKAKEQANQRQGMAAPVTEALKSEEAQKPSEPAQETAQKPEPVVTTEDKKEPVTAPITTPETPVATQDAKSTEVPKSDPGVALFTEALKTLNATMTTISTQLTELKAAVVNSGKETVKDVGTQITGIAGRLDKIETRSVKSADVPLTATKPETKGYSGFLFGSPK